MFSDRPLKRSGGRPAQRTVTVDGALRVATAWSDMTAWLASEPRRTLFDALRPTIEQAIVLIGFGLSGSWVVLVSVDVNSIQ